MGVSASMDGAKEDKGLVPNAMKNGSKNIQELIEFVYPVYYTKASLLPPERELAEKAWKAIVNGRVQDFLRRKAENPEMTAATPMALFIEIFFSRLLEVHPTCQGLFKGDHTKRGKTLAMMLSFILSKFDDDEKLPKCLDTLVAAHNHMGVRAVEFGIFGEVIFYALKQVLGPAYDIPTHVAWIKIYSRLLTYFIPRVVEYEMGHKAHFERSMRDRMGAVLGEHVACLDGCPRTAPSDTTVMMGYSLPTDSCPRRWSV